MGSVLLSTCAVVLALQTAGLARAEDAAPTTEPPPAIICGLEGFQLDTLQIPDYWQFNLEKSNCIIPNGVGEDQVSSCTIYFSVCKAVPSRFCDGHTNSSTCEEVTLNDHSTHQYAIGDYRGNNEFTPLGGHTVGFTTIRQGSQAISSRLCNETYETVMVWNCDESKVWNPSTNDANKFFVQASSGDCLLNVELAYNGSCFVAPTLAPDTCQLEPYNFVGLASKQYWTATVSNDTCYNPGSIGCTIFISFCGALPLQDLGTGCYGAAACQVGTNADNSPYSYSMGLYKTAKYADNKDTVGGGFHLDVENGSIPDGECTKQRGISTRIVLSCDPSANWTDQDLGSNFHISHDRTLKPCYYEITLQYYGACESVGPIEPTEPFGPSKRGPLPQSFVGWILIGIFFFVVVVYLFVGAGFEYFVKGARGVEVIPNYAFWMLFLSLVLEGCKFSFNAITCFQFEGSFKNPLGGPGKSSIDYDKI